MTDPPRVSSTHQFARPTRPVLRSLYTRPSIDCTPAGAGTKTAHAGGGGGGCTGGGGGGGGGSTGGGGVTGGGGGGSLGTLGHLFISLPGCWSARFAQCAASWPNPWETPTTNGVATKATSTAKARIFLLAR